MFYFILCLLHILTYAAANFSESCDSTKLGANNSAAIALGNRAACFCAAGRRTLCRPGTVEFHGTVGKFSGPKIGTWSIEKEGDHWRVMDLPGPVGAWTAYSIKNGKSVIYVSCNQHDKTAMVFVEFPNGVFEEDDLLRVKARFQIDINPKKLQRCLSFLEK